MKQNASNSACNTYQLLTQIYNHFAMDLAKDQNLSDLFDAGSGQPEKLSDVDKKRFFLLCEQLLGFHECLYFLNSRGNLADVFYEGWKKDLHRNLKLPGIRYYWRQQEKEYSPKFCDHVNGYLHKKNLIKPDQQKPQFKGI